MMSTEHCDMTGVGAAQNAAVPVMGRQPLQRLAAVRRQQGVSRRTVARRLNVDILKIDRSFVEQITGNDRDR